MSGTQDLDAARKLSAVEAVEEEQHLAAAAEAAARAEEEERAEAEATAAVASLDSVPTGPEVLKRVRLSSTLECPSPRVKNDPSPREPMRSALRLPVYAVEAVGIVATRLHTPPKGKAFAQFCVEVEVHDVRDVESSPPARGSPAAAAAAAATGHAAAAAGGLAVGVGGGSSFHRCWRRYSEFEQLVWRMLYAAERRQLTRLREAWEGVVRAKRWRRCLDADYLTDKARNLATVLAVLLEELDAAGLEKDALVDFAAGGDVSGTAGLGRGAAAATAAAAAATGRGSGEASGRPMFRGSRFVSETAEGGGPAPGQLGAAGVAAAMAELRVEGAIAIRGGGGGGGGGANAAADRFCAAQTSPLLAKVQSMAAPLPPPPKGSPLQLAMESMQSERASELAAESAAGASSALSRSV